MRFAFAGFRHGHIFGLYHEVVARPGLEVVATCEEHEPTRAALQKDHGITVSHDDIDRMLAEVDCDVVAIGDYYQKRGSIAIRALKAGRHVVLDKPICTDLAELAEIRRLAQAGARVLGCQLDLRGDAAIQTLRRVIRDGLIGEVHTLTFTGQHPLNLGVRPQWYFEPGKHGGTINDIAIHGFDALEWMTGRRITEVVAARAWNARCREYPHFQDGAQLMLKLDNGGGVLADVSYLAPNKHGSSLPQYWRFTVHGEQGMAEGRYHGGSVMVTTTDDPPREVLAETDIKTTYLDDFLDEINGQKPGEGRLSMDLVLRAAEVSLTVQKAADDGRHGVAV